VRGGVSSRRLTTGATAAVAAPEALDPSTRYRSMRFVGANGIRYAYLNELTGQAVEKRKSRKSMLGLLATAYRTSNNAGLGYLRCRAPDGFALAWRSGRFFLIHRQWLHAGHAVVVSTDEPRTIDRKTTTDPRRIAGHLGDRAQ